VCLNLLSLDRLQPMATGLQNKPANDRHERHDRHEGEKTAYLRHSVDDAYRDDEVTVTTMPVGDHHSETV
jgi:hypothetical protein